MIQAVTIPIVLFPIAVPTRLLESLVGPAAMLLLVIGLAGQSQERLAGLRDAKLQLPHFKNAKWIHQFSEAREAAKKTGKPIFAYFTRSDVRCPDSISLECGALAEAEFTEFSERVVPFCNLTTKVKTDPDQGLFAAKGGTVYPRVVFMDANGKVTYVVEGTDVSDFQKGLAELTELAALEKRVAAKDRTAHYPLLRKQLELAHIDFPAAEKRLKRIPRLKKAQKRELEPLLFRAEVLHIARRAGSGKKARAKAGEKLARRKKGGSIPTGAAILPFWRLIMDYAEVRKKPDLYEEAMDTLQQEFPEMKFTEEARVLRKLRSKDSPTPRIPA